MDSSLTNLLLLTILLMVSEFGDAFDSEKLSSFCQFSPNPCRKFKPDLEISHSSCESLVESILCSKCNSFNHLSDRDFCSDLWKTCHLVPADNLTSYKLSDFWESETAFCEETEKNSPFVDGARVVLSNSSSDEASESRICMEKIGNGTYLNMVPHPDGSNRIFLADQGGKVWLTRIPEQGSGKALIINDSAPFIDISDWVYNKNELGLMGIAFHPQFLKNGRFFLSFNCDRVSWSQCSGKCACNSDLNCDPSSLTSDFGSPCQFQSVISEFTVNGTASQPYLATYAFPKEVRRIFTMGLPFTTHHGGQILFGPEDGYLYFMMGDGGGQGDPYNFAQNKKSLLGKIMRLDVDSNLSGNTSAESGSWGSYSIPRDNPYKMDTKLEPEIWAVGFRNPWRCSFDLRRPSYFLCADVGQDNYEEVDIVKKGGNYGWRVYEGPYLYNPPKSPGGNTSAKSINPIFPVMGYNHSEVGNGRGSASITGGHFYRATSDPCLDGRYLFADLFGGVIWTGTETPENSGNFTETKVKTGCALDSPLPCETSSGSFSFGIVFSFGQDNRDDSFILTQSGIYRVVRPSRCKFLCSTEKLAPAPAPAPSPPSSSPRSSSSAAPAGIRSGISIINLTPVLLVLHISRRL